MRLIYTPDGQEPQRWDFDLGRLRTAETEAIEKRTSMAYDSTFREALLSGNIRARRALLWTFLRRDHHTLKFEDVDFAANEVRIEMDRGEWTAIRAQVAKSRALSEDDRYATLATIDQQLDELDGGAEDVVDDLVEESGKATANTDDTATP